MKIETKKAGKVVIIYPPQRLDMTIYNQFDTEIMKLVKKDKDRHFLLNFSGVKHLNSMYLSSLVKVMKELHSSQRRLKFCCVPETVKNVFNVTDLLKIFEVHEDEEEALNSFNNSCAVA